MNIQLHQFIEQKKLELEQSGKYRHVSIYSKEAVMLRRNGIGQQFLSTDTPYTQNGHEVKTGEFPDIPSMPFKENATEVIFEVIEKRKRNPSDVKFYFLWIL
ncbi:hypothetical protein [Lysinibacillus fusiformis]|uniref:Uncharacterized protein n=1 Tax=Lysinibacillus fusiformis TaxID=28031 RepID=A0A1E4R4V9_9BACI|nr:hypothetical protein [Lysinibacillus fusiformis]ODV55438.1 hypothetical protein BG258_05740 [Lysinibacillus fusiformis]